MGFAALNPSYGAVPLTLPFGTRRGDSTLHTGAGREHRSARIPIREEGDGDDTG